MKDIIKFGIIIFHFIIIIFAVNAQNYETDPKENSDDLLYVSIIDMIARPEKLPEGFNRISMVGFLSEGGHGLFLTREYAQFNDAAAIYIPSPEDGLLPERCTNRYIRVTGHWRRGPRNLRGFSSVEKIEIYDDSQDVIFSDPPREGLSALILPQVCWESQK